MPSSACIDAIKAMTPSLVSIANAASTDVPIIAMNADALGFAVDIGSYDMCMRQQGQLNHCLAGSIPQGDPYTGLSPHSGICVPVMCTSSMLESKDISTFLHESLVAMVTKMKYGSDNVAASVLLDQGGQQRISYYTKLLNTLDLTRSTSTGFTCGDNAASMTVDRWLFFTGFAFLLATVIVCTVYHMTATGWNLETMRSSYKSNISNKSNNSMPKKVSFSLDEDANVEETYSNDSSASSIRRKTGFSWTTYIEAFSLVQNIPNVFYPPSKSNSSFEVLDGLRAISIMWIILGHTIAMFSSIGLMNPASVLPPSGFLKEIYAQLLLSSRFAVDTFFFISGFLVVTSLLKRLSTLSIPISNHSTDDLAYAESNERRAKTTAIVMPPMKKWIWSFYGHRLVRILPPYIFSLLLWWKIGVLLGTGPFWYRWLTLTHRCDKYFWTNLLFINNLYPMNVTEQAECFYVTWYLAVDMQFYLISPIFVWLFLKKNAYGIIATVIVCLLSCSLAFVETMKHGWSAHSFDGQWVTNYAIHYYTKPLYRIPVYCIGMLSAMIWNIKQKHYPSYKVPKALVRFLLILSSSTILILVFGFSSAYKNIPCKYTEGSSNLCGSNWSLESRATYNSLAKVIWAVAIAIITLLSGNNQGASIQTFLSHPVFRPFANVTFAVYLLHTLIINIWALSRTQKLRYSHIDFAMTYIAVSFVSFVCGLIITVLIEIPISKVLMEWLENSSSSFLNRPTITTNIEGDGALKYQIIASDYNRDDSSRHSSRQPDVIKTEYTSLIPIKDNDDENIFKRFTVFISKL